MSCVCLEGVAECVIFVWFLTSTWGHACESSKHTTATIWITSYTVGSLGDFFPLKGNVWHRASKYIPMYSFPYQCLINKRSCVWFFLLEISNISQFETDQTISFHISSLITYLIFSSITSKAWTWHSAGMCSMHQAEIFFFGGGRNTGVLFPQCQERPSSLHEELSSRVSYSWWMRRISVSSPTVLGVLIIS